MNIPEYKVNNTIEEYNTIEFEEGNGLWWQSRFRINKGYGFGYAGNFTEINNTFVKIDYYDVNLLYKLCI